MLTDAEQSELVYSNPPVWDGDCAMLGRRNERAEFVTFTPEVYTLIRQMDGRDDSGLKRAYKIIAYVKVELAVSKMTQPVEFQTARQFGDLIEEIKSLYKNRL